MTEERQGYNHRANDLDMRLNTYYGPPLPEQPLSSDSWEALYRQLGQQERGKPRQKRRLNWHGLSGIRRPVTHRTTMPSLVQESLRRVMNEAHWHEAMPQLHCTISSRAREPFLRTTSTLLVGRPAIRVTLPVDAPIRLQGVEVDVLLAAGLARTVLMNRLSERMLRFVLACFVLLSSCLVIYGIAHGKFYPEFPIAIGMLVIASITWAYRQYRLALLADTIVVNWLGRSRVCDGLHQLAGHERRPHRRRLSEPSLDERIKRVCGTRVAARGKDLTLVG